MKNSSVCDSFVLLNEGGRREAEERKASAILRDISKQLETLIIYFTGSN